MNKKEKKVVFVAGYGRSGSTLLCAVLGGSDDTVPLGEFNRIFMHYVQKKKCACEKPLPECQFWGSVIEEFKRRIPDISLEEAASVTEKIESYRNLFLFRYKSSDLQKKYDHIWSTIFDIVCKVTKKSVLIDASKSSSMACNRIVAISRLIETRQIHLVRDPRSVTSSTLESRRRRAEKRGIVENQSMKMVRALRTLLSWLSTNCYVQFIDVLGISKIHVRVSYESLTGQPIACLKELSIGIDEDLAPIIEKINRIETFPAQHIFSGDLQRMYGDYTVKSEKVKWPTMLSRGQKIACLLAFPLACTYGYFK